MADLELPESWKGYTMTEAVHYNGGNVFFAYLMRCVQQPRLSRYDRYERKTRSVTSTWKVDGVDQPDIAACVAALAVPPLFTREEISVLERVPEQWADLRKTEDMDLLDALTYKGAIEWQSGKCRRRILDAPPSSA